MVTTTKKAALAFKGANGIKQPVSALAMVAFINANGGQANLALLLNANAVNKGVLFGGGKLWQAMQLNAKTNAISARGQILWACVNGLPTGQAITKANIAKLVNTNVPTSFKPIPLTQIQQAHAVYGAGITHNTSVTAGGTANQNALLAILNGGFGISNQTVSTYGNAYGSIVAV
tara:strand:- start:3324 stop:3848 length:525 start_codon:yes stop_codon:yes gene_type:complete